MIKRSVLTLLFLFFFCGLASATIEITQPLETYNFGDSIFVTVTLNPAEVSGSFEINMICDASSVNLYKISPAEGSFSANKEQKINHRIDLTKEFIGTLSGDCYIQSSLGQESVSSNHFLLTDVLNLNVKLDKYSYSPSESVIWTIDSTKANGRPLNGFVEVSGQQNSTKPVVNGVAAGSFQLFNNTAAGSYTLEFYAYDLDENGILNQKRYSASYEVKQVPTSIALSLPGLEATPGTSYEFAADLFDQTGNKMDALLTVVYTSPNGKQNQLGVNSGSSAKIDFPTNATPGKYTLTVSQGNLKQTKDFTVLQFPKVSLEFLEDSSLLIVKNIGNVPYVDSLNVVIGEQTETIELNLKVGEEKRFNLQAPNGLYDVSAQSGDNSVQKQVFLTGRAIGVDDWKGLGMLQQYPFIWIFIVGVLVLAGLVVFIRFYKNKTYNYGERIKLDKREDLSVISAKAHMKKQFLDLSKPMVDEAESNLSMKGSKDYCSVVSLNVKNHSALGVEARNKLNEIISDAKAKSGVVDWRGSHALIIFSPLITKTYKNEIIAAKVAWKIKIEIDTYNARFKDRISYNIGLNAGEMISSLNNGKLNYTSLGNSILLAKRISDLSESKLLASEQFRQKLIRELKVEQFSHSLGNLKVFNISRIADVEANDQKLKDLLKRTSFS